MSHEITSEADVAISDRWYEVEQALADQVSAAKLDGFVAGVLSGLILAVTVNVIAWVCL